MGREDEGGGGGSGVVRDESGNVILTPPITSHDRPLEMKCGVCGIRFGSHLCGDNRCPLPHSTIWQDPPPDLVNYPPHYTSDPSGVECIAITRHRNFNVGNAIKLIWRCGLKDITGAGANASAIEDLKKARWYLADEIKRLGGEP